MRRNVTILGATGSIGRSTLDVLERHPDRYRVFAVTAHRDVQGLIEICERVKPALAVIGEHSSASEAASRLRTVSPRTELLRGEAGLVAAASATQAEVVMAAIVGGAGLAPTLAAAKAGKTVLLANKEALVMTGRLFMDTVKRHRATLLPIDSEHNAIFQCLPAASPLQGGGARGVSRIILTGSGGPFRTRPLHELGDVTPAEACAHPNWSMGPKISIDSATMMNKALEVIEAHWIFDAQPARIEVLVHPQSVVHSMVEYDDGSVIAQLGNPDMRTPIAHALAYPDRIDAGVGRLDLARIGSLTFERPDRDRFPALRLAYEVLRQEGDASLRLNAANEVAVEAFLGGRLRFPRITAVVEETLAEGVGHAPVSVEEVLELDRQVRRIARSIVDRHTERA